MNQSDRPKSHLEPIRRFLALFFKHSKIFLLMFFGLGGIILLVLFTRTAEFEASAKLMVEKKQDSQKAALLGLSGWAPQENYNWINSEVEVIKSYPVAVATIESVGRKNFLLSNSEAPIDTQIKKAVSRFQQNLDVRNDKNSNIIAISFKSPIADQAQRVVDDVVENYISYRSSLESKSGRYNFLQEQIKLVNDQIKELEKDQARFKKRMNVLDPESQSTILLTRLSEYESQLTEVKTRKFAKQARLETIEENLSEGDGVNIPQTESSDSPSREKYIAQIKGDLLQLEIERSRLLQKYQSDHADIQRINQQILAVRQKIREETDQIIESELAGLEALKAEERSLTEAIDETKAEIKEFSQKEFAYNQITRGIDENKEIYAILLKQREEARISLPNNFNGLEIKVISPSIVSGKPVQPKKLLIVVIGFMVSILFALTATIVVIYFDDTIESSEEAERFTGVPVLGTVSII